MDISLSQGAVNTPDFSVKMPGETTPVQGKSLPLMEQPVKDTQEKSFAPPPTPSNYLAAMQVPQLKKPEESNSFALKKGQGTLKEEKSKEKVEKEKGTEAAVESGELELFEVQEPVEESKEQGSSQDQDGGGKGGDSSGSGQGSSKDSHGGQESKEKEIQLEGKERPSVFGNVPLEESSKTEAPPKASPVKEGDIVEEGATEGTEGTGATSAAARTTLNGYIENPQNAIEFLKNVDAFLSEVLKLQAAIIDSLPEGPEKTRFVDFLKKVTEALADFQALLNKMQTMTSKEARERSKAQLDASLAKIHAYQKEMEKLEKKQAEAEKKAKEMKGPMKALLIMGTVMLAIAVVTLAPMLLTAAPPLGAIVLAMMIVVLVDMIMQLAGEKSFLMEAITDGIGEVTNAFMEMIQDISGNALTEEQMELGRVITKFVVIALLAAIMVAACPTAFVFGGSTMIVAFIQSSGIISEVVKASGESAETASQAELWVGVAIMGIALIAGLGMAISSVASSTSSAGARIVSNAVKKITDAIEKALLKLLQSLAKMTSEASQKALDMFKIAAKLIGDILLSVSYSSLAITTGVQTMRLEELLAEIALIRGKLDSEVEVKDEVINILKKMIQKLLEMLEGITEEISTIGKLIKKTFDGASDATTELYG